MTNELVINARPYETRVALVENGVVSELYIDRKTGQELLGNIYRGRVMRVLPGMQAAFVDIGLDRSAFLYVSDVHKDVLELENLMLQKNNVEEASPEEHPTDYHPLNGLSFQIEDLLQEGQDIMVQISKEPIGTKGARLTSYISLAGRHLVLMPTVDHIGVSRRIEDQSERDRLREIVHRIRPSKIGFIVRTVSEGANEEKLRSDMDFLLKLWSSIQEKMARSSGATLLYKDLSISLRSVRDLFTREVDSLVIDSREEYDRILAFSEAFAPRLRHAVRLYDDPDPLFDAYGIEMEISRALEKKIWLKSGGYIVIEMTEALTSIDVNTGSYVGKRNLEETILKTNLEAVKEIAYQLRLRNIGGLIVIDFIDMERKTDRDRIFLVLREALSRDKAKTKVLRMSELGLIEMTRKRTRENLNRLLSEPCPYCEGQGTLKSMKTICTEIFRDLERESATPMEGGHVYILVNPDIDTVLKEEEQDSILDLEKRIRKRIIIQAKEHFHLEQYEIMP